MAFILIVVVGLVAWALHLMQQAIEHREFSLMLAGFLVSAAAAATMAVYFLMGHYVVYLTQAAQRAYLTNPDAIEWALPIETGAEDWANAWANVPNREFGRF